MRWSWRLGRISGIEVNVHWTFLLLLVWIGLSGLFSGGPLGSVANLVAILIVFGIVVLHELGHAFAARYYGIPTRDITLLPIGGVARVARMPDNPRQELVVAAAGPAVNLVLAGTATMGLYLAGSLGPSTFAMVASVLLGWFVWANLALAIFNLIPAFPMDGGRILRAALAQRLSYLKATDIATRVGRFLGIAIGIYGLVSFTVTLMLIGAFVWFGATQEMLMVKARSMGFFSPLPGQPQTGAMGGEPYPPQPSSHHPPAQAGYTVIRGPLGNVITVVRNFRLP
ncbi:MAG: site-2 protease family protein [Armatimonadetes bacterium]|nr:site-2 protease family protein [Armatimonadota bacterium]